MSCTSIKKSYLTARFCGGPLTIIAWVTNPFVILAILEEQRPPSLSTSSSCAKFFSLLLVNWFWSARLWKLNKEISAVSYAACQLWGRCRLSNPRLKSSSSFFIVKGDKPASSKSDWTVLHYHKTVAGKVLCSWISNYRQRYFNAQFSAGTAKWLKDLGAWN